MPIFPKIPIWKNRERVPLADLMAQLSDSAMMANRPPPVIETDLASAMLFASLLAQDIGCSLRELTPAVLGDDRSSANFLIQFDGVKIVARRVDICKHEVDGWREHFGPLADIWS